MALRMRNGHIALGILAGVACFMASDAHGSDGGAVVKRFGRDRSYCPGDYNGPSGGPAQRAMRTPRYAVGIEDRLSRLGAGEITPVGPLGIKTELMADLVLRPARQGEDRDQRDPENHSINLSSFIQDG